jgi:glycosyltransferase involved in cell wall biosynthesis
VLYLVGQLGFGGSEGQLRSVVTRLDRSTWEPHVLVFHPSPNADHVSELSDAGVAVATLPESIRSPLAKLRFTVGLARRIRPQVVHSWTVHDNPYAALAGRLSRAPVRWGSLRGSTTLPGFLSLPGWYRRLALRSVDRVVVNSRSLVDEVTELGLASERVMLLANCVEVEPESGDRRPGRTGRLGFPPEVKVFGNIGNIRRVKNQRLFVRSLGKLAQSHSEVRGVIIGETLVGEERTREEIENEIERLGLVDTVVLAGFRPDVRDVMRELTAVCLTSDSEGTPNVVLEAMAEGVPVIATAVGGVPELVHHEATGWLVPPGDEGALAAAMGRVLGAPGAARRMAEAAHKSVLENRTCAAAARRLGAAYLEALSEKGLA